MAEKLERIFEYRVLLSRARELGIPLSPEESSRLDRLGQQLPSGVPPLDERDPYTLVGPFSAELVCAGRFRAARLCNATAAGLAFAINDPPALGERLLVHVRDSQHPIEYTFPARVISRVVRGVCGMSVAFEGLPSKRNLGGRTSGVYAATEDPTPTSRLRAPKQGGR